MANNPLIEFDCPGCGRRIVITVDGIQPPTRQDVLKEIAGGCVTLIVFVAIASALLIWLGK